MIQYLIIQLCDTSTSYCHYNNCNKVSKLISIEDLKAGIILAMKENLMIQFVYPDEELTEEYKKIINSIDHNDIVSSLCKDKELVTSADVVVLHDWTALQYFQFSKTQSYVLRTSKDDFFDRHIMLKTVLPKTKRFNVVFTDMESFGEDDYERYRKILGFLSDEVSNAFCEGNHVQCNLLTDRLELSVMNNCDAGWKNITLAPNGEFYICPAFYIDNASSVGDVYKGINIPNPQLYRLDYAPICLHCDSYQCKRCVWLNKKTTLEVNTPSHQQCVLAHLERNASRKLMENPKVVSTLKEPSEINEIDYLDPFDRRDKWDYEAMQKELIKFHKENY